MGGLLEPGRVMLVVTMSTAGGMSFNAPVLDRIIVFMSSTSDYTGMELAWMTRLVELGEPWVRTVSAQVRA